MSKALTRIIIRGAQTQTTGYRKLRTERELPKTNNDLGNIVQICNRDNGKVITLRKSEKMSKLANKELLEDVKA